MTQKHTPTPWEFIEHEDCEEISVIPAFRKNMYKTDKEGNINPIYNDICMVFPRKEGGKPAISNAAFIVTACNSHYELLEAIKKIMTISSHMKSDRAGDINKIAAAAYAKAEGAEITSEEMK
jgi:hypothetical protein